MGDSQRGVKYLQIGNLPDQPLLTVRTAVRQQFQIRRSDIQNPGEVEKPAMSQNLNGINSLPHRARGRPRLNSPNSCDVVQTGEALANLQFNLHFWVDVTSLLHILLHIQSLPSSVK